MGKTSSFRGIWSAIVTPVDEQLNPDAAKTVAYCRELLENGCDGINLLGTTGEAMSFSSTQRLELMQALARADLPMSRVMVGTGAASLDDAVRLTRAALELDFAAALVMPPFFFRDALDDGVVRFFDALLARVPITNGRMLLYNFPQMSGITFHPDLIDRLLAEFSDAIAGLKDSSNDRALQTEAIKRHPELAVFPGSELYLWDALAYGAAGCISGSVALWPELAQTVYLHAAPEDARRLADRRAMLDGLPLIPAVRHCIARLRGDDSWQRPLPPLVPLSAAERTELQSRLQRLGL